MKFGMRDPYTGEFHLEFQSSGTCKFKAIASIFGGAPKPQGPSEAALKAQADQAARLEAQETKAKKDASATRAVIAARSGRGQGITLNPTTGERGVISGGKLGGGA